MCSIIQSHLLTHMQITHTQTREASAKAQLSPQVDAILTLSWLYHTLLHEGSHGNGFTKGYEVIKINTCLSAEIMNVYAAYFEFGENHNLWSDGSAR